MSEAINEVLDEEINQDEEIAAEIAEEAGIPVSGLRLRGVITFILPDWGNELTFLYTACTDMEALPECAEGELKWVPVADVMSLPLWEGDRIFLPLLRTREDCFSLKLVYAPGGQLIESRLEESV